MAEDNREHKSRLFEYMYGSPENAEWLLSLYNAVNHTNHTDASAIRYTTIETVMYLGMYNDVSFIIADEMSLYEQQSTYNPNMPVRMLQYLASLYEKHIYTTEQNKFGSTRMTLPSPKLVVFYNGGINKPDEMTLRLTDSFPDGADADVEVRVRMLNINLGKNKELLEACKTLHEYAWLVNEIRTGSKDEVASAIDRAIEAMPDDFEIKAFLMAHKAEVKGMLLTEYDEARTMELFRKEGEEQGRKEGIDEGAFNYCAWMVRRGQIDEELAAESLGVSVPRFRQLYEDWVPAPTELSEARARS